MYTYTRAASKVMPSSLLYWPTTSKMDVGDMTGDVERFHQYSILLPCDR